MQTTRHQMTWKKAGGSTLAALVAIALAGCGGGGSGGASGDSAFSAVTADILGGPFQAQQGASIQVTGHSTSESTLIKSMVWSATSNDPTAPALVLSNANCATATKNDVVYPSNGQKATGTSDWTCAVAVAADPALKTTTTYNLNLTTTDGAGTTKSKNTQVTYVIQPSTGSGTGGNGTGSAGSNGLLANAGGNFTIQPGSTAPLSCSASKGVAPYTFKWSVSDNAGLPISLSSYSAAQSSFVAPNVSTATSLTLQCDVTDASGSVSTSLVKVNVLPNTSNKPLVAFTGGNYTIQPNGTAPLSCQGTGGVAPYTYQWTVTNNAGLPISLSSYTAAQVSFVAPNVTAATVLGFQCMITDAANNTSTSSISVTDSPSSVSALTASAGLGFSVTPGSTGFLHCSATGGVPGTGGYRYQWSVTDNAGLNLPLTSYNTADSSFTAPSVSNTTSFTFQCNVTDQANNTASSTVTVVDSSAASTALNLVASAGKGSTVSPGQTVTLDGSGTGWFTAGGIASAGPTVTYQWSTSYPGVVINNANAALTTFTAPNTITTPTLIPFTLTVTSGASTSTANVLFMVDPFGPFSLVVNPPAQAVKLGTVATMVATGTSSNATPTLYYKWTFLSGPTTPTMGGDSTSTMGFVPLVGGVYVFQVAVGYQPITASYPGTYFATATVTAQ